MVEVWIESTLTLLATHVLLLPGMLTEFTHVKLLIWRVKIGASLPALRYFNVNSSESAQDPVFVFFALR
jgi:hypothetical protein